MPTITTTRKGRCSVCRGVIDVGELAAWTHAEGAKHPECATKPGVRANEYAGLCVKCGAQVARREGVLVVHETRTERGVYAKTYLVHCAACVAAEAGSNG